MKQIHAAQSSEERLRTLVRALLPCDCSSELIHTGIIDGPESDWILMEVVVSILTIDKNLSPVYRYHRSNPNDAEEYEHPKLCCVSCKADWTPFLSFIETSLE